jgi:hypothetical protein
MYPKTPNRVQYFMDMYPKTPNRVHYFMDMYPKTPNRVQYLAYFPTFKHTLFHYYPSKMRIGRVFTLVKRPHHAREETSPRP